MPSVNRPGQPHILGEGGGGTNPYSTFCYLFLVDSW